MASIKKTSLLKPDQVDILGTMYSIEYVDKPSDVDIFKRKSFWGQIDYWTRTIRIYDKDWPDKEVFQVLLHESLHGIKEALKLKCFDGDDGHEELDILAMALCDFLFRNGFIEKEE